MSPASFPQRLAAAAVVAAAVAAAAATSATAGQPPAAVAAPWSWSYLGGNLTSAIADAQSPGSVNSIDEVTGWAAPSGVYALLAPDARDVTAFYRFTSSPTAADAATAADGGAWTLLSTVNESDAAAAAAARGTVGVRGDARVVPPAVTGGVVTADTGGGLGGRLWLYGGVAATAPFNVSAALYEYDPSVGGGGTWARLAGGAASRFAPCDAAGGPTPCGEGGNTRDRTQALLVDRARRALLLLPRPRRRRAGADDGASPPQQVWRFDLDRLTWTRLHAAGGPSEEETGKGFAAAVRGDTLTLIVAGGFGVPATVWRLTGLGGGGTPRWEREASPPVGVSLAVNQYGTWTDGTRFVLNYIPGALPVSVDGVNVAAVPGVTVSDAPPMPFFFGPQLTDVDRFYVYDTATGRGRAVEAPSLRLNERGVNNGPARPPPEGDRVAAGAAPLRRYAPVTGGTVLRDARPGGGTSLVGYLQGGVINNWQQGGLLRFAIDEAVLVAAFGDAPPLPPPPPPPPPQGPRVRLWGQCGGIEYRGPTACADGLVCVEDSEYYSQCRAPPTGAGQVGPYGRCGGRGYPTAAPSACVGGFVCRRLSEWWSQCEPAY